VGQLGGDPTPASFVRAGKAIQNERIWLISEWDQLRALQPVVVDLTSLLGSEE
jgi:hypothetical protein